MPGWNNPDAVQSIHSSLSALALLFFAALVVFEVLAHFKTKNEHFFEKIALICFAVAILFEGCAYSYGKRNDELSNLKIASLNAEAEKAMERASRADENAAKFAKDAEDLRKQAASTYERAARAEATAKGFEAQIAESRAMVASANKEASEANARAKQFEAGIAEANRRASEANEIAQREALAFLQLKVSLADRTLSPEQQTAFIFRLSTMRGIVVDVATFGDNAEIEGLSIQLLDCLRRAGWVVNAAHPVGGGAAVKGILVGTKPQSDPNTVRAGESLIVALRAAGLSAGPWAI